MSVNSTVASTLVLGAGWRTPVRNPRCGPGVTSGSSQVRGPSAPGHDQPGVGDVLGQVAPVLDGEQGEVAAVQHQRRRLDQREQRADVDLEQGPQEEVDGPGLAIERCILAQRRNRSSPAGWGWRWRWARPSPRCPRPGDDGLGALRRDPDRVVVAGHIPGAGVAEDQALVRSGRVAAKNSAIGPASAVVAMRAARRDPAASMTAATSSA